MSDQHPLLKMREAESAAVMARLEWNDYCFKQGKSLKSMIQSTMTFADSEVQEHIAHWAMRNADALAGALAPFLTKEKP